MANESLINARKELRLTVSEAAKQMGLSHGMLSMLETRRRKGSDTTKIKVANFYKKSVEELFYTH